MQATDPNRVRFVRFCGRSQRWTPRPQACTDSLGNGRPSRCIIAITQPMLVRQHDHGNGQFTDPVLSRHAQKKLPVFIVGTDFIPQHRHVRLRSLKPIQKRQGTFAVRAPLGPENPDFKLRRRRCPCLAGYKKQTQHCKTFSQEGCEPAFAHSPFHFLGLTPSA